MNTHCLYLSYDGLTDPLGQSQVLPYLTKLSQLGYEITVISFEKPVAYASRKESVEKIVNQYQIHWHPLQYTKFPPVLSTMYDMRMMEQEAVKIMKQKPYKLVHCRSYLPAITGEKLKTRFNIPFIFDMRGFWADERIDGNIWNLNNPVYKTIYKYFKRKEKLLLEKADHTITLTNKAAEIIQYAVKKPVSVIPCCADTDLFDYIWIDVDQKKEIRRKLGIAEDAFVLNYLGSIGTWYMLPEMLDFFKCLLKQKPESIFHIVSQENPSTILEVVSQKEIPVERIIITPAQRNELPELLSIANFSIFFIKPAFSKQGSSPTKQGELMSMGIPIICNAGIGDTDTIIAESQSGFVVDTFTEEDYNRVIQLALHADFSPALIREYAQEHFNLKKGAKAYAAIYSLLVQS